MHFTATRILALMMALLMLSLAACSKRSEPGSEAQSSIASLPESIGTQPAAGDDETDFMEKAYALGYTDEQLEYLKSLDVPEDTILNLSVAETDGPSTSDDRYVLGGYDLGLAGSCVFLYDRETGKATVLPDWQNGYSRVDFLDDEAFYTSDYKAGVRLYHVKNPREPYAVWNLTDSATEEKKEKLLFEAYRIDEAKLLLAFWCEYDASRPSADLIAEGTETYKITLINYDGDIIKEFDTGVAFKQSKSGIAGPSFDKPNLGRTVPGIVYFDIGEESFQCDYQSGTVSGAGQAEPLPSAEFSLGRDGDAKTVRAGDTLGDWKLADLKIDYSGDGALNMLEATFEGNVTLRGTITRNFLSEDGYDFTVAKEDEARMPFYVSPEMSYKDDYMFILNFSEELGNPVTLDYDESLDCTVTISDYHFTFAFMTAPDSATVVAIEAR